MRALETELLGKKSPLNGFKKTLGGLDPEERRTVGQALNEAREVSRRGPRRAPHRAGRRRAARSSSRPSASTSPSIAPRRRRGHLHLVTQSRDRLEDVFVGMGFTVAEGPEVETDWYNFEALNIPASHPARGMWDTLYVDLGEPESTLLRTHTSPVQIRVMQERRAADLLDHARAGCTGATPPTPATCRCSTRSRAWSSTGASASPTWPARSRRSPRPTSAARSTPGCGPSYFPFTEPSAEYDINCIFCEGTGCRTCGQTGWLELGGCGMVHPNVFAAVGYDPEEWSGFAFGFGIDRLALMRHGVDDIRELFTNDIRFLEQF